MWSACGHQDSVRTWAGTQVLKYHKGRGCVFSTLFFSSFFTKEFSLTKCNEILIDFLVVECLWVNGDLIKELQVLLSQNGIKRVAKRPGLGLKLGHLEAVKVNRYCSAVLRLGDQEGQVKGSQRNGKLVLHVSHSKVEKSGLIAKAS